MDVFHNMSLVRTDQRVAQTVKSLSKNGSARARRAMVCPSTLFALILFYIVAISPLWFSLGDHTFYERSEGRYATASWGMLQNGEWLVPRLNGEPHLTKPPLIYWLQAAALGVIGHSELAVRLPSALAGSLTALLLMCLAGRIGGSRFSMLATAVLSVMPLHVALSRLTLTDALLALFWFGTLAAAWMAVHEPNRRGWPVLMWLSVALGLMTKGPVAWIPLVVICVWLSLGKQWASLQRLWPVWGFLISLVPLMAWVFAIVVAQPDVVELWRHEMIDRVAGSGAHTEPFWFFIPVIACGLFPATVMLSVPGWNKPWRMAWDRLVSAKSQALWALAVVLPFVLFSLSSGKLASYLLPLAPPAALLAAHTLDFWLRGDADCPLPGHRPPDVRISLFVAVVTVTVTVMVSLVLIQGWNVVWPVVPVVLLPLACGYLMVMWRRRPTHRAVGLVAVWFTAICLWLWALVGENWLLHPGSERQLIENVAGMDKVKHLRLVTFEYTSTTLPFYYKQEAPRLKNAKHIAEELRLYGDQLIIIADAKDWEDFAPRHAAITKQFTKIGELQSLAIFGNRRWILRAYEKKAEKSN